MWLACHKRGPRFVGKTGTAVGSISRASGLATPRPCEPLANRGARARGGQAVEAGLRRRRRRTPHRGRGDLRSDRRGEPLSRDAARGGRAAHRSWPSRRFCRSVGATFFIQHCEALVAPAQRDSAWVSANLSAMRAMQALQSGLVESAAARSRCAIASSASRVSSAHAEEVRADLRSREFATGLAQKSKFDARYDGAPLFRRCAARERLAQDRNVATMGLELEELKAREH